MSKSLRWWEKLLHLKVRRIKRTIIHSWPDSNPMRVVWTERP